MLGKGRLLFTGVFPGFVAYILGFGLSLLDLLLQKERSKVVKAFTFLSIGACVAPMRWSGASYPRNPGTKEYVVGVLGGATGAWNALGVCRGDRISGAVRGGVGYHPGGGLMSVFLSFLVLAGHVLLMWGADLCPVMLPSRETSLVGGCGAFAVRWVEAGGGRWID